MPFFYKRRKTEWSAAPQICETASVAAGHLSSPCALRFRLSPPGAARHLSPTGALHCPTTSHYRRRAAAISHRLAPCAVPLAQPDALR
eukprot:2986524-Pleurochrysis_carterae.AAC.1